MLISAVKLVVNMVAGSFFFFFFFPSCQSGAVIVHTFKAMEPQSFKRQNATELREW